MSTNPQEDIRDLLGMRTTGAWLVLACYFAAMATATASAAGYVTDLWPPLAATVLLVVATTALVVVPGDPLPASATIALTISGPVACALVLSVTPPTAQSSLQTWIHSGGTAIYCFMNVRGRRITPWIGLAGMLVVFALWGWRNGQGAFSAAALVVVDAAPVAMAALLSFTLRPTAKAVFSLRAQTTVRVAELSADAATAAERRRQFRYLDNLVRHQLERIAGNEALTDVERIECELLEAHLRDRLRAPIMSELGLDDAVYRARLRGIEVTLVDDRGSHTLDENLAEAVHRAAAAALAETRTGHVTVRTLPVGRSTIAAVSVSANNDNESSLREIDRTGSIHRRF